MELIAILFVIAIWDVTKSAVKREAAGAPSSGSGAAPASRGRRHGGAGGATPRGVRQRQAGYWLRETLGGFPAARTGWHAGWLAHRQALAQQRGIRENARTNHVETERDVAASIREHRKRQAAARAEIETILDREDAKGRPARGRKAVDKAADEVARKRAEREHSTHGTCAACGAPDGESCIAGCPGQPVRKDVPLPADSVPAPRSTWEEPHARIPLDTVPDDSSHLHPGERRCEGCGGTGRNDDSSDACPVCRGWGSGPPDPAAPLADPDAVCTACGNPGKPGDPVLADPGGNIHLSHAQEQQEAYWDRLNRLNQARRSDGSEIDDAVIGADHGFEGEYDTHPPSPTTNGAPVSDTNYTQALQNAKTYAAQADEDFTAAQKRRVQAETDAEGMQALEVDAATLSSQMDLVESARVQEEAAKAVLEYATAVADGLQQRHGGLQAAHDDAPVRAAKREMYEGS